jgi:nicotinate-nucleotide pyrophosphorylase (carboxylating)
MSGPPGSITKAIETLRRAAGFSLLVTIECQSYDEAAEALDAGANIVMLDNMVGNDLHDCARELKRVYGKQGKGREFLIESSGGVVEDGLVARIGPDIDILSTSAVHQVRPGRRKPTPTIWRSCGRCVLTATAAAALVLQSVQHVDFSLKIQPKKKDSEAITANVEDSPA